MFSKLRPESKQPTALLLYWQETNKQKKKTAKAHSITTAPVPLLTPKKKKKKNTQLRMDEKTHTHTHLYKCTYLNSQCPHAHVNTNKIHMMSLNKNQTN